MSTTVPPRVTPPSRRAPARPAKRAGGVNRAEIPVLIRLPDLNPAPGTAAVGSKAVAHAAHGGVGETANQATPGASDSSDQRRARRESAAPSGSFWITVPGKAILALLLGALALACYALLSGKQAIEDDGLGLEIVWPESTPGEPVGSTLWHEPLAAEPIPANRTKNSDVASVAPQPSTQSRQANPPITPPSSWDKPTEATSDPALPSLNQAGSDLNHYFPEKNSEPAPSLANPYEAEQRYSDRGSGSSAASSGTWTPGSARETAAVATNPSVDAAVGHSTSTWTNDQAGLPYPSTTPSGAGEPPYAYPNTGIPPLDLRHATRPLERAAQLPPGTMPSGQYNNSAPQGVLQGTIQNPPLRPQNERTGSGLY